MCVCVCVCVYIYIERERGNREETLREEYLGNSFSLKRLSNNPLDIQRINSIEFSIGLSTS